MTCTRFLRLDPMLWYGAVLICFSSMGCNGSSDPSPANAPQPSYPPGWQKRGYSNAFRVPSGAMEGDRAIEDWYQKGFAKMPQAPFSTGWSCDAWTRLENTMRFTAVSARQHGITSLPPTVVQDAFAMMARRSLDMKEIETPGAAGGGYGLGKAYQGENARLFVRIGSQGAVLYIVTVGGDGSLDASNQHLRAFFDGFEPIAR